MNKLRYSSFIAYLPKALHRVILKPEKFRKMKAYFQLFSTSKQQVVKKDGVVPAMGHITGRNTVTLETNRMLDKMRVHSNKHYQEIMEADYVIFLDTCGFLSLISELQYLTIS